MHGGKRGTPVSDISQAYADRVEVRGRDLTGDLMLQAVAAGILGAGGGRARLHRFRQVAEQLDMTAGIGND
jgi:hypothetical protein